MSEHSERRLTVLEEEATIFVVWEDDPADWIASFQKTAAFPAREWADNMVRIYNARIANPGATPPLPPGQRPASYHPPMDGLEG